MNELTKQQATELKEYKDTPVVTSLRIAELTGKDHSKVIRDIKVMLSQIDSTYGKFALKYRAGNKVEYTVFALPKRELELLLTGYSIPYRMKLLDELEEHRQNNIQPTLATSANNPTVGFEESSSDKFKALMIAQNNMEKLLTQQDRILDMVNELNEPKPIETVVLDGDNKLSDFIGKGSVKTILKLTGN
jgi:phage regulator Rha-like protein